MPNYLLEIGTEELPAGQVPETQEQLKSLLSEALGQANLSFEEIETFGTPRRTACIVKGLAKIQPTTAKKVKGPPLKSCFDANGKALPPGIGFAQKQGLTIEQLDREDIGGVSYLIANLTIEGKPAEHVLMELVPRVIEQISCERPMRWGSSDMKFSRPIRWLVSLLDGQEVKLSVNTISSGRETLGHRILAPGAVKIGGPDTYVEDLRKVCVLVDSDERRQAIEKSVAKAAEGVSGAARQLKGALLQEVVNITEWPCAVLGQFANEYLDLPDTLIETVMVHHQRYFPVEEKSGDGKKQSKLLPYFVSVSNNDLKEAAPQIKLGNERVLKARLADGRFFYFDDKKIKLSDRKDALAQLTYHDGLGSYLEKQERLTQVARQLVDSMGLDDKQKANLTIPLERTLELCKLDLVTGLVRELPELQGYVGSWYAQAEGQPPEVVAAIASHYSPRSTDDGIPTDTVGKVAAVVDKLDNLVSLFATGKRPTGSSDPYVLRRQAQGLIDILMDGLTEYTVDATRMMETLLSLIKPKLAADKRWSDGKAAQKGIPDLREFLIQRIKLKLADRGFKREVVDAVLSAGDPLANLPDVATRCRSMEELLQSDGGMDVVRAGVRIGNILKADSPSQVRTELFADQSENELWESFNHDVVKSWQKGGVFQAPQNADEYKRLLDLLRQIAPLVDNLFVKVMVNDPDQSKRDNRHALLKNIDLYFRSVADFQKMKPLLPSTEKES